MALAEKLNYQPNTKNTNKNWEVSILYEETNNKY
jgi:hypothetical protein